MIFDGDETREDLLKTIQGSEVAYDNILAMACIGAAFSQICTFEDLVSNLIATSNAKIGVRSQDWSDPNADIFLERYQSTTGSTLGRLITALEESGIQGRDIDYLRAIVGMRNDFVHRFMKMVPLPGDWERYGYTLEQFSHYTRWVIRHTHFAQSRFSRIMHKHGLLAGHFGDFGALLWNPDDPILNSVDDSET